MLNRGPRAMALCGAGILVAGVVGLNVYQHIGPRTVELGASWAEHYSTVQTLGAHSDIAVAGQFSNIVKQYSDPSTEIPYSDFGFTVESIVSNPGGLAIASGTVITVHQTGGSSGNIKFEVGDDPLFQVGSRYVLFLRQYQPGYFFVVGGPGGRYNWDSTGMVTSFNSESISLNQSLSNLQASVATP